MPAVRVARDGFPVSEDLVRFMTYNEATVRLLVEDPVWAEDFAPNGTLLQLGDIITRKRYAATLEQIAQHGADAFYSGAIGTSALFVFSSFRLFVFVCVCSGVLT